MKKLLLIALMCLSASVGADTFWTPLYLGTTADSIKSYLVSIDGADTVAGGERTSVGSFDTTWTVSADTSYLVIFKVWFPGSDTASSTCYGWDKSATASIADADISTMMDSITDRHGSGSYTPSGSGDDTVKIYAIDTSGTDAAREDVKITIQNAAGNKIISGVYTDDNGAFTVKVDAGTYSVLASKTGYYFPTYSMTVSGNDDSVEVAGYDIEPDTPGDADLSNVYGYIKTLRDRVIVGATVYATPNTDKIGVDTSGETSVIILPTAVSIDTDSLGRFQLYLRRTHDFGDTTRGFYNITANYDGEDIFSIKKVYVPPSGNLNLGDTLFGRGL